MRLTRTILSLLTLTAMAAGLAGLAVAFAAVDRYGRDLPDHTYLRTYVPRTGSRILAADGALLSRKVEQRRTFVPYAAIPPLVVRAFVSAEDRGYFGHDGIDPVAILRAGLSNATGGPAIGGSTITQQVAKNLLVGNERSLERKIREALLAMRMDRDLGKERVLEIYLNEIYLGLGAYGVAEAAQTYFGKGLADLRPEEAALLAGMPKAPSAYNPSRNPARALERRNYVLRRMEEDGAIDARVRAAAEAVPVRLAPRTPREDDDAGQSAWFEDLAWKAAGTGVGTERMQRQDVTVATTLRPDLQAAADAALRAGILRADRALGWRGPLARVRLPVDWTDPRLDPPAGAGAFEVGVVEAVGAEATLAMRDGRRVRLGADGTRWTGRSPSGFLATGDAVLVDLSGPRPALAQDPAVDGALVAVDPRTGDVLALVGGYSHERSSFDRATQARRQAGSSFKPILYSAALRLGYDATSPLLDAPIALEQGPGQEDWRPNDAKGAGHGGLITVRRALELSRNMATVRLLWDLGLDDMQDMARRLGVAPERPLTYVAALGAVEVTPLQMALAYSTFANGGRKLQARYVTGVKTREGEELGSFAPDPGERVLDPVAAAQMGTILRGVVERGTARRAFEGFKRPFSGKTGTTNAARDAWFVGLSPEIVVAVWIGRDDNRALADDAGGGKVAAPIVREFLERGNVALSEFKAPPEAVTVPVDLDSGLPTSSKAGVVEVLRARPDMPTDQPRAVARGVARANRPPPPRRTAMPEPPRDYLEDPAPRPLDILTED